MNCECHRTERLRCLVGPRSVVHSWASVKVNLIRVVRRNCAGRTNRTKRINAERFSRNSESLRPKVFVCRRTCVETMSCHATITWHKRFGEGREEVDDSSWSYFSIYEVWHKSNETFLTIPRPLAISIRRLSKYRQHARTSI